MLIGYHSIDRARPLTPRVLLRNTSRVPPKVLIMKNTIARYGSLTQTQATVVLLLLFCFAAPGVSAFQSSEAADREEAIPTFVRAQIVWLALSAEFTNLHELTVVYVRGDGVELGWLPTIANAEFRLITAEEEHTLDCAGTVYYLFLPPSGRDGHYTIGLVHGTTCNYFGGFYGFEYGPDGLEVARLPAGFGGGVDHCPWDCSRAAQPN